MKNSTLHIIEPTLANQAGHCFGYVQSILNAHPSNVELWINKHGTALFDNSTAICHGYFSRKLRKLQQFFLYRKLLKTQATIFIPTAGRIDMLMLDKHLSKRPSASRIILHFHQFSQSPVKLAMLKELAQRHPNWTILAPTQRLMSVFQQAGFKQTAIVACPSYSAPATIEPQAFRYALYAGATRADKGFYHVAQTIAYNQQQNTPLPFHLQLSPPESGRYDDSSKAALQQLKKYDMSSHITVSNETLAQQNYLAQFNGSICLQVYDPDSYHDKFSGITLDAICSGAPVITIEDTWMADTVKQYNAGIVITDREPQTILNAIHTIKNDYQRFQQNCLQARTSLIELHHPKHTVAQLQRT
ncbi:MAG: glycosyltransferase family 1 protein [Coxiellaceae bacterium]|nr:glycosyltransferase family 1 protein [Coxiellaceae bacterium]